MKKFLSALGSNKDLAFVSASCEIHWPSGEGPKGNGENKKQSRKQDLCCEKRLKKMGREGKREIIPVLTCMKDKNKA